MRQHIKHSHKCIYCKHCFLWQVSHHINEGKRPPAIVWLLHFSFYQLWVLSQMHTMHYTQRTRIIILTVYFFLLGKWNEVPSQKKTQYIKILKLLFWKSKFFTNSQGNCVESSCTCKQPVYIFMTLAMKLQQHTVFHFVFTINHNCFSFQLIFHLCSSSLESH